MAMNVTVEKQKDGTYIAYNTDSDGLSLIGTGDTVNEAKDDFFNSMQETVQACKDAGIDVPPVLDEEPAFKFDISSLFEYDSDKNGISFNIAALTQFLGRASCASTNSLLTRKGGIRISWKKAHVPLLVIPDGIDKKMVAKELNLQGKTVRAIDMADVIPLDDNEKLIAILKGMESNRCALWNWRVASIIGLAAALGFIAGYIITK